MLRHIKPVSQPRYFCLPDDVKRELNAYRLSMRPGQAPRRRLGSAFPSVLTRYVAEEHRPTVALLGAQSRRPAPFLCPVCMRAFRRAPCCFLRPEAETLTICPTCRLAGNPARALATVAPQVAADWENEGNGRPPTLVSADDTRPYSWIHRGGCGERCLASVKRRVAGAGCPYCNPQRSKLECLLLTDLAALGVSVEAQKRFHPTRRWRMDRWLTLPTSQRVGVEVDGRYWHAPDDIDDVRVNAWCAENSVILIRVRDQALGPLSGAACRYVYFDPAEPTLAVSRRLAQALADLLPLHPASLLRDALRLFAQTAQAHLDEAGAFTLLRELITPGPGQVSIAGRNPRVAEAWNRCQDLNHGRRAENVRADTRRLTGYFWCGHEGHPPLRQTPLRATRWQRGVPCPACRPLFRAAHPGHYAEVQRAIGEGLVPGVDVAAVQRAKDTSSLRLRACCSSCGARCTHP